MIPTGRTIRLLRMLVLGGLIGVAGCGGGSDYRATLAKCRATPSISLTPKCRDARAAAFNARFGSGR